jgi:hypothetical protein
MCSALISGRNFGLFVLRECSVCNGGRNFGLFVYSESLHIFIRISPTKAHFRIFPYLTRSILNKPPCTRSHYRSCTHWACRNVMLQQYHSHLPLYSTFTTLLTVFSVFPSLDHPNHSQPAFTRSKHRSYTQWTRWDGALGRCSRLH